MASLYKLTVGEEQEFHRVLADGSFTAELAKRLIKSPFLVHNLLAALFAEGVPEVTEGFEDDNPELKGEMIKFIAEGVRVHFLMHERDTLRTSITEVVGRTFDRAPLMAYKSFKELYYDNGDFHLYRDPKLIFKSAETPHAFLFDTIAEVIRQTLLLDPDIREENIRREAYEELKRQVWRNGSELPSVKLAEPDDTCEFQWWLGGADSGSMLDAYCRGAAQVRLDLDYGDEPRCLSHANWDIADVFLKIMGTPREGNTDTPPDLKEVIDGWLREKLKRATER